MKGKRVLLGITAGIAAYKTAYLVRILKKKGADVKCIMTPASSDFISPLVLSTLSGNPVSIEFWNKEDGTWNNHVELALWADVMLIAPLTANSLSKIAHGACDNLLLATYLSMKSSTIVAPAMDLDMYAHPTTKENLLRIAEHGVTIIPAEEGELASGLHGEGRMAEPETIAAFLEDYFAKRKDPVLGNKHVLITAGPTFEAIDPVRFIGNHSSGKMGYAIANRFLSLGAKVTLISGPTYLDLEHPELKLIRVNSADEMLSEVQKEWSHADIGVFAAAVADYKPVNRSEQKIKKSENELELTLVKNPDILKWAGENKNSHQALIGFALETENVVDNAKGKLAAKNLDMIVVNTPNDENAAFGYDTNKITILDRHNNQEDFELKSKELVAVDIIEHLKNILK